VPLRPEPIESTDVAYGVREAEALQSITTSRGRQCAQSDKEAHFSEQFVWRGEVEGHV